MSTPRSFDHMIGDCEEMQAVFAAIEKLAPTEITVLILGETGTGKELVARSLHARGTRSRGPFVALNCAAIPASLIESELFGFEKGSFTGAVAARTGHIERAHGGTLFLDEIAEMPHGAQAKLLRVLQDHRVQRVGGTHDKKIDVRIVAATHQDLPGLVEARAFRRDLYHRLNEVQLRLPPLRERGSDIASIAEAVVARLSRAMERRLRLSPAALQLIEEHDWPGNIRELENTLQRAAAVSSDDVLAPSALDLQVRNGKLSLQQVVERATEAAVRDAFRRHRGNVAAMALELQIVEREVQEFVDRFDIS